MAIDELLNPNEDGAGLTAIQSWRDSQTRVYAAGEIIRKLDNFEQPDLVSESLSTLNSHIRQIKAWCHQTDESCKRHRNVEEFAQLLKFMVSRTSLIVPQMEALNRITKNEENSP